MNATKTTDEIIIIGGGIIGLSIAVELRSRGANVSLFCKDFKEAAAQAAGGMLAPQAECIPAGKMLDLCLKSRNLYADWIAKLEALTGMETGYWPCGILAPLYKKTDSPTGNTATWLNGKQIQQHQPGLSEEVIGGWWYPEDGQVDNRKLIQVLWEAAQQLGVKINQRIKVTAINKKEHKISSISTNQGEHTALHYILATGAWTQELLSIPVTPKKGQMLSVKVPIEQLENLPLKQVLFGENTYIVPRQNGKIVIGATTEKVGFTDGNTAQGVNQLLNNAIRLYPIIKQWELEEIWWGFRPTTPDEMPILGESEYVNLTLATGHYRNGILLAPITALLIADLTWEQKKDIMLDAFSSSRFTQILNNK